MSEYLFESSTCFEQLFAHHQEDNCIKTTTGIITDDEWMYHPKHVEQFTDTNKLCNVASCWIYIGIYLICTDP
jgi:hypothetical protein